VNMSVELKSKKFIIFFLILVVILSSLGFLIPPLIETKWRFFPESKSLEVVGFLPYWNLNEETKVDFAVVDTLIYFGLQVDENGEIMKVQDGGTEPGLAKLNSEALTQLMTKARQHGKKVVICFASFDASVMKQISQDKEKQATLIGEIINTIAEKKFDGVDIDFEYFPDGDDPDFGKDFNSFLINLKNKLGNLALSVDIYPKAVIEDKPYNLKLMDGIVDRIILMAYDFTQSISDTTGPVAPLKAEGEGEKGYSVTKALQASFGKISGSKLVLGIPLYGYEWETVDHQPRTSAYSRTGIVASFTRVKELIEKQNLKPQWDATASSPWLSYEDEGVKKQIYYEDMKSISLKVELAKQLKLAGIAFWALGYEGEYQDIWQYLKKTL